MRIERNLSVQFGLSKDSPERNPILLKGVRQMRKTWAMEAYARECFDYYVKFDFDRQPELKSAFLNNQINLIYFITLL